MEDAQVKFDSIDKVLDFAIEKEQEAADFYTALAGKVKKSNMKDIFKQFSLEEQGHKAKLQNVKKGKLELAGTKQKIADLKIAETVTDVVVDADFDYQQALIVAMKAEKAAYKLYTDLADIAKDEKIVTIFKGLAQEEAKHKLRFETEYDEIVLKDN